ncbi:MAG: hypothetical protein WAW37_19110 [Syntrophobacteraceae bacterium]
MKKAFLSLVLLLLCSIMASPSRVDAKLIMVTLEVYTTAFTDPAKSGVDLVVKVTDDGDLRGPNTVASVKVAAPASAGDVFDLTHGAWDEFNGVYHARFTASQFDGGVVPTGTYTATVKDKTTPTPVTLTGADSLASATFLKVPVVMTTIPASLTPTITWSAVAGAKCYQFQLMNVSKTPSEPIFRKYERSEYMTKNSFTMPAEVLLPNTNYMLRVTAVDNDKNPSRTSRSTWKSFTTPAAQ